MLDELSKGTAVYTLRDIDKLEQNRNWDRNWDRSIFRSFMRTVLQGP